jgi:hypothetical protein
MFVWVWIKNKVNIVIAVILFNKISGRVCHILMRAICTVHRILFARLIYFHYQTSAYRTATLAHRNMYKEAVSRRK